jgi:nucleoside-diphosphate-sugar epimerase
MTTIPTTVFAQAKSCIRQLLETMAVETGTEARWARVFYAYGSGQRNTSLIPMTIRAWQEGAAPELRETQRAIDLIHVDDVARGIVALALQDGPSGTFNLGSGRTTRVADVVEVVRASVSGEELTPIPTSSTETRASWADISKMQDAFGWEPEVDLSNGVRLMLDTGAKP